MLIDIYILISPYSKIMRNGQENPKNYPYWQELIRMLDCRIIQIGITGEQSFAGTESVFDRSIDELTGLVDKCACWVAVDNFLPHLAHLIDKRGVAIFSKSDPLIFGHPENINLLKDRKYLRHFQFDIWEKESFNKDSFVGPDVVYNAIKEVING